MSKIGTWQGSISENVMQLVTSLKLADSRTVADHFGYNLRNADIMLYRLFNRKLLSRYKVGRRYIYWLGNGVGCKSAKELPDWVAHVLNRMLLGNEVTFSHRQQEDERLLRLWDEQTGLGLSCNGK
jgi:hypothetical protein